MGGREIRKCKVNPIYFAEKYCYIKSNDKDTEYKKIMLTRMQKKIMEDTEKYFKNGANKFQRI